jgi:hypothetical protein
MSTAVSVGELLSHEIRLESHEAVAVALELMSGLERADERDHVVASTEPPTVDTVYLMPDASVRCDPCAGAPAVSDIGRFLNAMLPAEGRVSGALRYTIARAVQEVDAPPFDSLHAFSSALERFEKGRRDEVIGALYALGTL